MRVLFSIIKFFVFMFNFLSLILGIGTVTVSALGLEKAEPNTDEHTYFIIGIILGSLVCMTTLFGCYGVISESLGVNTIYTFFLLILLVIHYMQIQSPRHHAFYGNAKEKLRNAWSKVETEPNIMQNLEYNYNCCALDSSHDYTQLGLKTPTSCYNQREPRSTTENLYRRGCSEALKDNYDFLIERENIFNCAIFITEFIAFLYACGLSVLLYKMHNSRHFVPVRGYVEPYMNHNDGRTYLVSN